MPRRQVCPKVQVTKNYRLFNRNLDNRPLKPKQHRALFLSMKKYGFLSCFPIVAYRNGDKTLGVKEGQHRLLFAESLGLPVFYIITDVNFDVAEVNCTAKIWRVSDYAEKYVAQGNKVYKEIIDFAATHSLPLGVAVALLGGTTSYGNVRDSFMDGTFTITDRKWADVVASIYSCLVNFSSDIRNARFMLACMGVCRVKGFNPNRLMRNAKRCRDKLLSYSTKDAYLDMLETIYNFGCKTLVGLKAEATMVMRERNAVNDGMSSSN